MSYYDEQRGGNDHRSPSPLSQANTYNMSNSGRYDYDPYNDHYPYHDSRRSRRSPRSDDSSSYTTRSDSRSPAPRPRKSERRDTLAKTGILVGALAIIIGALHLLSGRERRHAERQADAQRQWRVAAKKRDRRRRQEAEEERMAEEEEMRRYEYDEWREKGRRGMYIDAVPSGYREREENGSTVSKNGRGEKRAG